MPRPKNHWRYATFFDRFAAFIMPEPNSGCWIWIGAVTESGYGKLGRAGRTLSAHRCAYRASHGEAGPVIRHTCDTKLCVNPSHLLSGTDQDNSDDAVIRNLVPFGERNGLSKLTEQQVREIRAYRGPLSQRKLGARYGVSQAQVSGIKTGKFWRRAQ